MRSKFIDSKDGKSPFTTSLPAGRYGKLQFTTTLTTLGGATLEDADLGNVIITQRGTELIRMPLGVLRQLANLKGGFPAGPSGNADSAERVVSYVPFGFTGFPNVLQVQDNNEIEVRYEPAASLAAKVGANAVTVRVEGWENKEIPQRYNLKMLSQNQQANAAATLSDNIQGRNIVALLLKDPDSVVSEINAKIGDEVILDNVPFAIIKDETNILNKIESAGNPLAEVAISEQGIKAGTFNAGGTVQTTFSGAGNLELYKVSFDWLPEAQVARNRAQVQQFLNTRS